MADIRKLNTADVDFQEELDALLAWESVSDTAVNDRQGASWFGLGSSGVSVVREADDILVDSVRVRVWQTQGHTEWIFSDGFESGGLSGW